MGWNYALGNLSRITGLGMIVYGIFSRDMTSIVGGAAMSYAGNSFVDGEIKLKIYENLGRANKLAERSNELRGKMLNVQIAMNEILERKRRNSTADSPLEKMAED